MAVIDYPTILARINTNINDNTSRDITPADVRGILVNLLDNDRDLETALSSGGTVDLTAYYTKTESDAKYALKTSIPSLTAYYTKTESDSRYALSSAIPDVSGFLTSSDLPDLSVYYTKTQSDNKFALKTAIPDVSDFLTSTDLDTILGARNFVNTTQLSTGLATKQDTNVALTELITSHDAVIAAQHTDKWLHLDGSGHLVFEDLPVGTGTGTGTGTGDTIDLTPYLKKDGSVLLNPNYVPSQNQGLATKKYVDDSRPDLTPYLESSTASATYALKTEIPSLTGYVRTGDLLDYYTKTESETVFALKTELPNINLYVSNAALTVKLRDFYTKTESDAKYALISAIPDVSGFLTSAGLTAALQPYALTSALPDLTSYYTKTESDNKYALKTAIPALPDLSPYLKADGSIPLDAGYAPTNPQDLATLASIDTELRRHLRSNRESYRAKLCSDAVLITSDTALTVNAHSGMYLACQGNISLTINSSQSWQQWEEIGIYSESGNVTLVCGGVTKINGVTTSLVIKALDYRVIKMHRPNEWYCVA